MTHLENPRYSAARLEATDLDNDPVMFNTCFTRLPTKYFVDMFGHPGVFFRAVVELICLQRFPYHHQGTGDDSAETPA